MTPKTIELATASILNEAEYDEVVDDDNEEILRAVETFVQAQKDCPYDETITAAVSQILTNEEKPDETDDGYELDFPTNYHDPGRSEEFDRVGGSPD
jgi:hypothetical protein